MNRAEQVAARLAELSGATAAEYASALREFDVRDIAAALAAMPAAAGSLPDPSGEPDGDVLTVASGAAVWSPGGGSTPVFVAETTILAAQILDIFATPVEIVPAPAADQVILAVSGGFSLNFGTTPYSDAGGGIFLDAEYDGLPDVVQPFPGPPDDFTEAAEDKLWHSLGQGVTTRDTGDLLGKSLVLRATGGVPLNGDSTITVAVLYHLLTLP